MRAVWMFLTCFEASRRQLFETKERSFDGVFFQSWASQYFRTHRTLGSVGVSGFNDIFCMKTKQAVSYPLEVIHDMYRCLLIVSLLCPVHCACSARLHCGELEVNSLCIQY